MLTARYVAKEIEASPTTYYLLQIGRPAKGFLQPLVMKRVEYLQTSPPAEGDPDLAVIIVEKVKDFEEGNLTMAVLTTPQPRQDVVSVGCSEMETLPSFGTGIVTTSTKQRELVGDLPLKRTVFGSSLRSFPGLSGAPVLNDAGQVVGIVAGGVKYYVKTGETLTKVDEKQDWETFGLWTWITPVAPSNVNRCDPSEREE